MGELFFLLPNLLSHNNNHLTAPCGLAAASDVEGERKRGGGRLIRLDSDQSRATVHYNYYNATH